MGAVQSDGPHLVLDALDAANGGFGYPGASDFRLAATHNNLKSPSPICKSRKNWSCPGEPRPKLNLPPHSSRPYTTCCTHIYITCTGFYVTALILPSAVSSGMPKQGGPACTATRACPQKGIAAWPAGPAASLRAELHVPMHRPLRPGHTLTERSQRTERDPRAVTSTAAHGKGLATGCKPEQTAARLRDAGRDVGHMVLHAAPESPIHVLGKSSCGKGARHAQDGSMQ